MSDNSCFNTKNLVVLEGKVYERLYGEDLVASQHKYRQLLEYDHYDYVEDEEVIAKLDKEERI